MIVVLNERRSVIDLRSTVKPLLQSAPGIDADIAMVQRVLYIHELGIPSAASPPLR